MQTAEIQEADDFGSGKIANVMYKLDGTAKDSDVALLIVDVKNNLHGAFKYNFGADANAADINLALSKGDVTISGALDHYDVECSGKHYADHCSCADQ